MLLFHIVMHQLEIPHYIDNFYGMNNFTILAKNRTNCICRFVLVGLISLRDRKVMLVISLIMETVRKLLQFL